MKEQLLATPSGDDWPRDQAEILEKFGYPLDPASQEGYASVDPAAAIPLQVGGVEFICKSCQSSPRSQIFSSDTMAIIAVAY